MQYSGGQSHPKPEHEPIKRSIERSRVQDKIREVV